MGGWVGGFEELIASVGDVAVTGEVASEDVVSADG